MTNMGSADRMIRFILGAILIVAPFLPFAAGLFGGWGAWKYVVSVVGLVMVATAAMRFCPAYTLLGARTDKTERT